MMSDFLLPVPMHLSTSSDKNKCVAFSSNLRNKGYVVVPWNIFPIKRLICLSPALILIWETGALCFNWFGVSLLFFLFFVFFKSFRQLDSCISIVRNWDLFNTCLHSLFILFCAETVKYLHLSYSLSTWSMDLQIRCNERYTWTHFLYICI